MSPPRLSPLLAALVAAAGCNNESDHAPPGPTGDAGGTVVRDLATSDAPFPGLSALRVGIPPGYAGTARQLYALTTTTYPPTGMTTPLLSIDNPVVAAGQTYFASFDGTKVKGNLYVLVFLFMQGGGSMTQPKAGVDYAGNTPSPFNFDGAQHDVGPVGLQILK